MEEPSLLSSAITNRPGEISDSNSSSSHRFPSGPTTSKLKGIVAQPNGHWGAQIYQSHRRIWLGTFKSKKEAAMAYDSAAIKLRKGSTHRNLPWTNVTVCEPYFQNQLTSDDVLSMIKDGSYAAKFSDYLRIQDKQAYSNNSSFMSFHDRISGVKLMQLFQKELTPSDVSKLNRLVIPKKYALKYFPRIPDMRGLDESIGDNNVYDLELVFFDRGMRSWKLRYCYWKSSQSFVFTRGWNRFAKEKGLRPRDRVIFSSYESGEQKLCIIDVAYYDKGAIVEGRDSQKETLEMKVGLPGCDGSMEPDFEGNRNVEVGEGKEYELPGSGNMEEKGFRLFGFQIV